MPLHEYECDVCGRRFEKIQKFSDPPIEVCPTCSGHVHKLISSPAFQFKGSGWYVTDYAKKEAVPDGKAEGGSKEGGASKEASSSEGGSEKGAGSSDKDTGSKNSGKSESSSGSSSSSESSESKAAKPATKEKSDPKD